MARTLLLPSSNGSLRGPLTVRALDGHSRSRAATRALLSWLALVLGCGAPQGDADTGLGGSDAGTRRDVGVTADAGVTVDGGPGVDANALELDGSASDAGGAISPGRVIAVDGRQVTVDGVPLELHGVCWSPVARGHHLPADFAGASVDDVALMQSLGINAVRTYDAITDRAVLDRFAAAGIWVLMTVYAYGGDAESVATDRVMAVIDHPAVLMWLVGNEWNYNGLYTGVAHDEAQARLERIAAAIHALDPTRPVATVHGEMPSAAVIAAMPHIQVWGLNVYRGITFGDLFTRWTALSPAPMFVSEYGSDAWDARGSGMENDDAQAEATTALTNELLAHSSARDGSAATLGGTIFEWSDEWWKDPAGTDSTHDTGGVAPGGGPYPDMTFNEEWWGVVDIDRNLRPAALALRAIYAP
jgi:hypothetical protein